MIGPVVADGGDQALGERAARVVVSACRGTAGRCDERAVGILPVARPLHRDLLVRARARPQRHRRPDGLEIEEVARPGEGGELRRGAGRELGLAVGGRAPDPQVIVARQALDAARRAGRRSLRRAIAARACRRGAGASTGYSAASGAQNAMELALERIGALRRRRRCPASARRDRAARRRSMRESAPAAARPPSVTSTWAKRPR